MTTVTSGLRTRRWPASTDIAPPGPLELAPGWHSPVARLVPYVFAITTAIQLTAILAYQPLQVGFDARLYAAAAHAWLGGADPWQVSDQGVFFAAPPPSLVLFAPFAFLPAAVTSAIWVLGSIAIAWAALRSLGAPLWWLLWWPIVSGCLVGSADVLVLGLLVLVRGRLAWLAPLAKTYALLPIVADRRWRTAAVALAVLAVSAVVLPWSPFLQNASTIVDHLRGVAATTSVYGQPLLMAIGVVALLALGFRRAGWLAVPVLWPYTQPHYLAASVPAMSPVLALAWTFPHPLIVLVGIVVEAALRLASGRSRDSERKVRP